MSGEWTYPFTMPITVAFRDLDMLGHVNNAVYRTSKVPASPTVCRAPPKSAAGTNELERLSGHIGEMA